MGGLVSLVRVGGPCFSPPGGAWEMMGVTVEVGMELDIWYSGLTAMGGMETSMDCGGAGVVERDALWPAPSPALHSRLTLRAARLAITLLLRCSGVK